MLNSLERTSPEVGRAPHNIEAEQALLGALLIDNSAGEYLGELVPGHFYDDVHAEMFRVMSEALHSGRTFTATTLAERFRGVQITPEFNGAQYLGQLMGRATTARNIAEYARTIMEASQRRQLILLADDIAAQAFDPNGLSAPEIIEDAERRLFMAANRSTKGREVSISTALANALEEITKAYQRVGLMSGLPTGFVDLDNKLGGLGEGNLIIIGGRPSMGKTALVTNIAHNVAETGEHVHFFSQEMTATELAIREIGSQAGVPSEKLRRGDISEDQFRKVTDAGKRLSGLSMTLDETGGITLSALATKARRMKRQKNTRLIIIDYLQLMQPPKGQYGNRVQDITEITIGLKALAKELSVPIIALSQLSRKLEDRTDKRPQLSDLRESGSIEQDADVVMFVFREEYYIERKKPQEEDPGFHDWMRDMQRCSGKAEVIIGKQRHGPVGIVEMAFDGSLTQFSDLARNYLLPEGAR